MITKNAMQLKAFIKKKAEENHVSAQLVMQSYLMERLLERVSLSAHKRNFILKGGFLIAAIVGLDTRTTMDLDTTIKGFTLTRESIGKVFEEICAVRVEDDVIFSVNRITDIREEDEYPGLRVWLTANYPPLAVPLKVDVTTGDKIIPKEIEYSFRLLFDDRSISVLAYNLETILAEKLETVLSRNIANTRPRDFYDIHTLYTMRCSVCDLPTLKQALAATAQKRGSMSVLSQYGEVVANIRSNPQMCGFWKKYQGDFEYAKDIDFDNACDTIVLIMNELTEL